MTSQTTQLHPFQRALFPHECAHPSQCAQEGDSAKHVNQFREHWCKRAHLPLQTLEQKFQFECSAQQFDSLAAHWHATRWQYDNFEPEISWREHSDESAWFNRLCQIFDDWQPAPDIAILDKDASFAPAFVPFMNWAWRQLDNQWRASDSCIDQNKLKPQLLDDLCNKLGMLCHRVLVLELNVARMEERLNGDTPKLRFLDFRKRILGKANGWQRLFTEYQVLARLVSGTLDHWVKTTTDLITRTTADLSELDNHFLGGSEYSWVAAKGGVSDPHCGGQGVWILGFENGEGERQQLVYKPKSMAIDDRFHDLLRWLNNKAATHQMPGLMDMQGQSLFEFPITLNRGDYGWSSFVNRQDVVSTQAAERFYFRQGAFLAILHLLGATDFHHENLIADGEFPVLVDLETLLHPAPDFVEVKSARDKANAWLSRSVMHTGMLPRRLWGDNQRSGVNLAGLGSDKSQVLPNPVPDWEGTGTDQMRQVRTAKELKKSDNLPGKDGKPISVTNHISDLLTGFQTMYRFVQTHAQELTQMHGPLMAFSGVKTRVVLRGTKLYSSLLYDGLHPDHMRHAFDRDNLMEHLWSQSQGSNIHMQLVAHEKRDLSFGDVPYFSVLTNSTQLRNSRGEPVCEIDRHSAFDNMLFRLQSMSEKDLEDQCFVIQGSVGTIMGNHISANSQESKAGEIEAPAKLAHQLGQHLLDTAFHGDNDVSWLSMDIMPDGAWSFNPTATDLYGGNAGIGWFLSLLARDSGNRQVAQMAKQIYNELEGALQIPEFAIHGGYIGSCSIFYAMVQMNAALPSLGPLPDFGENLNQLILNVSEDTHYDVIAGAAGTLLHALAIHKLTGSIEALSLIEACAKHLVDSACTTERGCYWPFSQSPAGLLGFSHGNAGIACALARASERLKVTGNTGPIIDSIESTITAALAYERTHFDSNANNWPDLREFDDQPNDLHFESQWCHGAPGVGLGRSMLPDKYLDSVAINEIEISLHTMLSQPMIGNHCLCHGLLGNLLVARQLEKRLTQLSPKHAQSKNNATQVLAAWKRTAQSQIQNQGPLCGIELPIKIPGLMSGLSGIGLALLYLDDKQNICNPMSLEYPKTLAIGQ